MSTDSERDSFKTIEEVLKMDSFVHNCQKAYFNILVTANKMAVGISDALKEWGLTSTQFNVLRILRGQHGVAISAVEIQERMIHPSSNVSRILDKLSEKGYIVCHACRENMRRNNVFLTEEGMKILEKTDYIPLEFYEQLKHSISEEDIQKLNEVLDKLRNNIQ